MPPSVDSSRKLAFRCFLEDVAAAQGELEVGLLYLRGTRPTNALLFPQHLPRLAAAIHRNRNITGSNWNLKSNEIEDSGASALGEAIGQLG
eukprot:CAMPEP_0174236232 /NCGR_PEP_ID=MMETSP0417-20130205/5428_1 /TAXON_ID=242541 /ORGANISM="Mayorella sp, Strain BSH-02190019" /LENGTH=90 /DNA_ID=CAMNT_0015314843 /DNA_START=292 /DNA_END=560 /DNA_ORIENTATION=+